MAFSCRDRAGQRLSGEMPKMRAAFRALPQKAMDGPTGSAHSRLQRPLEQNAASGMPACKMRVRLAQSVVPHDLLQRGRRDQRLTRSLCPCCSLTPVSD
jgi:hypothetical protein